MQFPFPILVFASLFHVRRCACFEVNKASLDADSLQGELHLYTTLTLGNTLTYVIRHVFKKNMHKLYIFRNYRHSATKWNNFFSISVIRLKCDTKEASSMYKNWISKATLAPPPLKSKYVLYLYENAHHASQDIEVCMLLLDIFSLIIVAMVTS